jgi:thiamine phosphate synthase YjbQ (UPF0047 family)
MGRRCIDTMLKVSGPNHHEVVSAGIDVHIGPDDLPAHVKSALIGASVTIPIKDGKLVRLSCSRGSVKS